MAWYGFGAGADPSGDIALRRYDADGVAQSSELVVAAFSSNSERTPAVATDSSGNFVVVWMSNDRDGSLEGVFARRFDAAGAAQGIEFQVNSYTNGAQVDPAVAVDADGDSVVVWSSFGDGSSSGVFARRLDSTGNALATEFQVNGFTDDYQFGAAVSMRADGAFVVTWNSRSQDGSVEGIFARRFDAFGVPLATEFQANTYTLSSQNFPAVAAQGDGDFVIAWASYTQDGDGLGVVRSALRCLRSAAGLRVSDECLHRGPPETARDRDRRAGPLRRRLAGAAAGRLRLRGVRTSRLPFRGRSRPGVSGRHLHHGATKATRP